ncbi:MAG: aspartate aminotransferase family protein [Verrucomicrobia bacterium]|nr:aspartate aminotransferase family protein [Verrucomicrobiota bacterium]
MSTPEILTLLRHFESRNVTAIAPDGSWPLVWRRAQGLHVWDARGKKYLDLTAAFGVAAAGHANPRVVRAGRAQMGRLLHAMGDVHPHELKARLARELSRITFERWTARTSGVPRATAHAERATFHTQRAASKARGTALDGGGATGKVVFCSAGFEAVEVALKTALLATGKPGVIALEGGYHGLGYGALNTTHRRFFREPFQAQLGKFGHFVPFPGTEYVAADGRRIGSAHVTLERIDWMIRQLFHQHPIGAILVEPVQGRGGIRVPPPELLPLLRNLCDEHRALLVADEIFTGFGRTGRWFGCEHTSTAPDLVCLGKAIAGGFPLAACVGRADLMDAAWPASAGEAIHTSTFLGHPVGCAMALAQIAEIDRRRLVERSARLGPVLLEALTALTATWSRLQLSARGLGLMAGVELRLPDGTPATPAATRVVQAMAHRGFILLAEGDAGNVLSFTPPLTITPAQIHAAARALQTVLADDTLPSSSPPPSSPGSASAPRPRRTPRPPPPQPPPPPLLSA